jgi:hypothetical protein
MVLRRKTKPLCSRRAGHGLRARLTVGQRGGGQHQGLGAAAVGPGVGRRFGALAGLQKLLATEVGQGEIGDAVTAETAADGGEQLSPNKRGTRIVSAYPPDASSTVWRPVSPAADKCRRAG